jgi:hypothetical protein
MPKISACGGLICISDYDRADERDGHYILLFEWNIPLLEIPET